MYQYLKNAICKELSGKAYSWFEQKLSPILVRISEIRALKVIQKAIYSAFPAIVVGFVVVFAFFNIHEDIKLRAFEAFRGGLSFMAMWVSLTLGYHLGKSWNLGGRSSAILAFLLFYSTFPKFDLHLHGIHKLFNYLSQGGLFVAILLSILFLKSAQYLHRQILLPRYPDPLARHLAKGYSFSILWLVMLIFAQLGIVVHEVVFKIFTPLMYAGDSLPWVLVIVTIMSLMWLLGLHGAGIVGAIIMPLYLVMINGNFHSHASGEPLSYIVTPPFFTLCFIGGSGATLPLVFYMWRSRSERLRKLARTALLPSLANINEVLIFGIPIVMNPILAVPFVIVPLILGTINYLAFSFNLVERIFILLPFCIPAPVLAYLTTGGDLRSLILILIDLAIIFVIWRPFYKMYERKVLEEETGAEKE